MAGPTSTKGRILPHTKQRIVAAALATVVCACVSGCCTSFKEYVHNGFKVGPNYCPPAAAVAERWIDEADKRLQTSEIPCFWWRLFGDPVINDLVYRAYNQNLALKVASLEVQKARFQLARDVGFLFPQQQFASGSWTHLQNPAGVLNQTLLSLNLNWEIDFWGRFRRTIAADEALVDAAIFQYDNAILGVLAGGTTVFSGGAPSTGSGSVLDNYITIRTSQERIELLRANVTLQRGVLDFVERRFKAGFRVNELDVDQARSTLKQTEAGIPALEIAIRQANDNLCLALGMPTIDLVKDWPKASIPKPPAEVAVGLPADLLRRRPDVRRAERLAAAQAEQIGIAEADFYPAFFINGTLGWQATNPGSSGMTGSVGPSFQWQLLNYGRIINNVRIQDVTFQQLILGYQNTVLAANQQAEDALVAFIKQHERVKELGESADAAEKAVKIVVAQFEKGAVDFNRYALIAQNLVTQQDSLAQARGQMANSLTAVYTALGGGWELRIQPEGAVDETAATLPMAPPSPAAAAPNAELKVPEPPEQLPVPKPVP